MLVTQMNGPNLFLTISLFPFDMFSPKFFKVCILYKPALDTNFRPLTLRLDETSFVQLEYRYL